MEAHKQHAAHDQPTQSGQPMAHQQQYGKLAIMTVLSFAAMYVLMYSMVDRFANVIPNVDHFYMAGLMTMPMVIIEMLVMSAMYMNKRRNALIIGVSAVALVGFFLLIRQQTAVSDKEYLKGMIPHHAAAILMSEQASFTDPEVKQLAAKIIADQQAEIAQMKAKLKALDN